jgi:NTP pyrophosphatase (non-canonical NTP hydrolase)
LVNEIADFFATFDFLVLQARLAEICQEHRQAVAHYKRALNYLRPGSLRTEILEAIARIAI